MSTKTLNPEEKRTLLELARQAIARKLDPKTPDSRPPAAEALTSRSGAFVTLHKHGRLRGCIGRFLADKPITETVEDMAQAAAFEDPRFPPLSDRELEDVDLEISVLTPMTGIENIEDIEVGRHGIYITKGPYRGVLLPQVAVEQGWDRMTFLKQTCRKAGLSEDCWQDPDTVIQVFSAEVFGEKELG